jgi:tetratricopeptide (TPR) repeat protein
MNNLALAYRDAEKLDLALPLFEQTLKLFKAKLGPEHPDTVKSMNNLALAYRDAGELDLALPLFEETLKLFKAKLGPEHPYTLISMNNLAFAYDKVRQFDKAEALYREQLRLVKQKSGADSPGYAGALAAFGLNLLHQKKWTEAEPLLRECQAIRAKAQPDVWTTFSAKALLGEALLGQKKYADAEPMLLAGYEGMRQREKTIPPEGKVRLPEAIERLVQLYEALDKKDDAAKWNKELDVIKAAQKMKEKQP